MYDDQLSRPIYPRLLYLTEWFEPEPIFKGLRFAQALADRGFNVEVATAFPNHPGGKIYDGYSIRAYHSEIMEGILLHRLFVYPSHDRSGARRMVTYFSFFVSSLLFCLINFRRYEIAYVYHPPILPALAAAIAGIVLRKPFIIEIQDLWPDSVAASGMGSPWVSKLLKELCNFTYRHAARIVCQSRAMRDRLIERGVPAEKLACIYNWSNYVSVEDDDSGACVPALIEEAFTGHINLVYGGNIGQAQALEHVVEAAALAAEQAPTLRVHLIGHGIESDRIAAIISARAPASVMLHGAVPPRVMDRIFDKADGLVLNLKDDPLYLITIPSKTQHYLSVGKPIVAGISGEAAHLLNQSGSARVVPNSDVLAMAKAMIALSRESDNVRNQAGKNARDFYSRELSIEAAMASTTKLITEVLAKS